MAQAPGPFLSAIVPTKDRAAALAATLAALADQEEIAGGAEVVVADNGSTDETPRVLAEAAERLPSLVAVRQPKPGPAAARNAAVAAASGQVLLLLGDDTAPARTDLFAAHAALHRAEPDPGYAVLGRIEWAPQPQPTAFMRWLDAGGPQFHYWELSAGGAADPRSHFYSSHLSLKREIFEQVGGFDERFPFAAFEDTELGGRLAAHGMRLEYHPELLVHHDHPTSIPASLRRAVRVGRSAAIYNSLDTAVPNPRVAAPRPLAAALAPAASPLLGAAARVPAPAALRRRVWSLAHRCNYAVGYREGAP
ncbi:MAG: glycosyltransferase [Solirubrobacterales bacterium]